MSLNIIQGDVICGSRVKRNHLCDDSFCISQNILNNYFNVILHTQVSINSTATAEKNEYKNVEQKHIHSIVQIHC